MLAIEVLSLSSKEHLDLIPQMLIVLLCT